MNKFSKSNTIKLGLILLSIFGFTTAHAQTAAGGGSNSEFMFYLVVGLVFFVAILVLITAVFTLRVLNVILNREMAKQAEEVGEEVAEEPTVITKFVQSLTDRAPVEKEKDIMLDHNYDGIKELDNHLPPWWLYLFYFTIAFGVVYLLSYHVFNTLPLQEEEYQNEVAMAEEAKALLAASTPEEIVDENSIEFVDNASWIAAGEKVFAMQCASCHAADGGGIVGPNLTDEYWLHGGGIKNVFKTVKYGVVQKGMIAWEGVISNQQMRDVSMYIMTLQGTTPANPKAPQGEVWVEEEAAPEAEAEETEEAAESEEATQEDEEENSEMAVEDLEQDDLALGKEVYDANCVTCHMADGGGSVGPNFTDDYWIHGCSKEEIVALIKKGSILKGMTPWEGVLTETEISSVADYILAFGGTTPANPKEPQGAQCLN